MEIILTEKLLAQYPSCTRVEPQAERSCRSYTNIIWAKVCDCVCFLLLNAQTAKPITKTFGMQEADTLD